MKKLNVLLCILCLTLMSCTGIKRGVDGNVFMSSSKPAFSVSVPNFELRTSGKVTSAVTTGNSLGGVRVDSWLAVYGGKDMEPMAIVAQSEVKFPYYWNYDLMKIQSINQGLAILGNFKFQACTYLLSDLKKDAFAPLSMDITKINEGEQPSVAWLVRRFATRTEHNEIKITLEYREKAPDNLVNIQALPFGLQDYLQAFEKRAQEAFVFENTDNVENVQYIYAEGLQTRYLDKNFLGSISYHEFIK